jgi:hypothetical protein
MRRGRRSSAAKRKMLSRETSGEVVGLQTVTPSSGPAEVSSALVGTKAKSLSQHIAVKFVTEGTEIE